VIILSQAGLIAAFVLIALLLIGVNLYSSFSWRVKAMLIVLVSAFYIVTYYSFPPLMGWPTDTELPKRFNLVAIYVEEPDKTTGDAGEIYLWLTDLRKGPGRNRPRAYRVPFDGELHAKVVEAGTKLRKGLPQLGELVDENLGPQARPTDESRGGQKTVDIEFFDLPDPLFPEK
jgi:hypothetical protein